jgi:hypothetical protein
MKRVLFGFGLAFGLLLLGTASVSADTMPTPGDGSAFGQHVAAMSPANLGMTGSLFGGCVSSMASQGVCPCPIS